MSATAFTSSFIALYTAHTVADHWVQTSWQAANKGRRDWTGRLACAQHVSTYVATQFTALVIMEAVTGVRATQLWFGIGLAVSAVTHYWADRRFTLLWLAERIGSGEFYRLGMPRTHVVAYAPRKALAEGGLRVKVVDGDFQETTLDNPCLGTGAYALDQSFHVVCLFVAALLMSIGAS